MMAMEDRVSGLEGKLITTDASINHTFEIEVDRITSDPEQTRRSFPETSIRELATSLAEHGQLQPILVRARKGQRGHWIIVAGERRWRAARMAGMNRLLAIERSDTHDIASLVENLQRDDLNPIEEALGIGRLSERYNWSQRELAAKIGRSVSDVNGMLAVARLPESAQRTVLNSEQPIARNLLIEIARIKDSTVQARFLEDAAHGRIGISQLRSQIAGTTDKGVESHLGNPAPISRGPSARKPTLRRLDAITLSITKMSKSNLSQSTLESLSELRDAISHLLESD